MIPQPGAAIVGGAADRSDQRKLEVFLRDGTAPHQHHDQHETLRADQRKGMNKTNI